MLKEYFRSLEEVTASEWLLLVLISLLAAMFSAVSRDDPDHPHLSAIFAGQSCYYALRAILPVCAFLREKMAEEAEAPTSCQ